MYATQRTTYQPANDQTTRPSARRVSIVILPARKPKPVWKFFVSFCLLLAAGFCGLTFWLLLKPEPLAVQTLVTREPVPYTRHYKALPPVRTITVTPSKAVEKIAELPTKTLRSEQPSVIAIPASSLVAALAEHIAQTPALKSEPAIHVTRDHEEDVASELHKAQQLLRNDQFHEALNIYDHVLATDAENHDALTGKTYALAKKGLLADAIKNGRHMLKIYPHDDVAEANLSRLMAQAGQYDTAIAMLDRAAREAPDNLTYRLNLAALYDRGGKHSAEALMLYKQVIDAGENAEYIGLPLDAIRHRVAYLESLAGTITPPSVTSPEAN